MKKRLPLLIIGALLLGAASWAGYATWGNKESNELVIYGNVDIRQVDLGFRVAGRIREMRFEEGDRVKKGQVIAVLDKDTFKVSVSNAIAQMEAMQATLTKMERGNRPEEIERARAMAHEKDVRLKNAQRLYERRLGLVKSGSISKQQFDDTLADRDAAQAEGQLSQADLALELAGFRDEDIQQARANLDAAKARLDQSEINLQDTEILAPTDGIILTRVREPGGIVAAGQTVYTLQLLSPVWIRTYVPEKDLGRIYPGMPAEIYTDTRPAKPYHGQIGFISPVAEFTPKNVETTSLRTDLVYRLRVIVSDRDHGLQQGMPVTVKLKLKPKTPAEQRVSNDRKHRLN
ncbi:MAG: secretion protein HlyD [Desulfomonilaceae bacterium]